MNEGYFDRHVRRMRSVYQQRLEALTAAAERHCGGALRLRPTHTGLHAIADLPHTAAVAVSEQAFARGVEVMPVSEYAFGSHPVANALMIGFAAVREDSMSKGMELLAAAIEATPSKTRAPQPSRVSASAR
jgi:GntR family transcriptional regulator/MocR family aminotransferase